jgi:surfactin synthase thioesterase subunit
MERMGYLEDKPNSLLAHCAGFIVAFEAALVLKKTYGYTPQRMVNIAMGPPQVRRSQGSNTAAGRHTHADACSMS